MRWLSTIASSREADAATFRPAEKGEIDASLRVMLADANGLASDEQVLDFLSFAIDRKLDLTQLWIAAAGGKTIWATLPVLSPGATALLLGPNRFAKHTPLGDVRQLIDHVADTLRDRGIGLAQVLIDPGDAALINAYQSCGFERLAELLYMQASARKHVEPPEFPKDLRLRSYSPETHNLFADAIERSYESSLDCPKLTGLRAIGDVIEGHKSAGVFDPNDWHVLTRGDRAIATLLLSRSHDANSIELVYLGLAPEARGRGVADKLMQLAAYRLATSEQKTLNLAVDALNTPATNLYYRHGLRRIGSRLAMVRELRASEVAAAR